MCGIAGFLCNGAQREAEELVHGIVADQRARGPDHQKVETIFGRRGTTVLGSNRLSILDLSQDANMPMHDDEGRFVIVFNGLIYNYLELRRELKDHGMSFRTSGDTEVVLKAFSQWGPRSFERFNGMFAIAIFDRLEDTLWLARDRFGVKPLFYRAEKDRMAFASTGSVMARHFGLQPNLNYAGCGLSTLIYDDDSDRSAYDGLKVVQPGHVVICKLDDDALTVRQSRYYDLDSRVAALREELRGRSVRELAELVLSGLQDAVDVRLRTDVGYGVSLSGGLDSTTVAALVAKRGTTPRGYSFGSPAAIETEGPVVGDFARYTGIPVDYIWPSSKEFAAAYWKTLKAQDAPFAGLSVVAQNLVFERARMRGVKVLLGGQGGDEVFMGYRKFHFFRLQRLVEAKRFGEALSLLTHMIPMFMGRNGRLLFYWRQRRRYIGGRGFASPVRLPGADGVDAGLVRGEPIWQRQMRDILKYSLPTLLRYEDRNSMGNSIESRLPFVDYRIVELGVALPEQLKIHGAYGKWIVRDVMKGYLPESIRLARYKRGFDVDRSSWIKDGLGKQIREGLLDGRRELTDFLPMSIDINAAFSDQQLQAQPKRLAEATTLLWLYSKRCSR